MSLSVYYEDSRACDARSIGENGGGKLFKRVLEVPGGHGKSPCFWDSPF